VPNPEGTQELSTIGVAAECVPDLGTTVDEELVAMPNLTESKVNTIRGKAKSI